MNLPFAARWLLALAVLGAGVGTATLRVGLLDEAGGVRLGADWVMTDFYSAAYHPVRAVLEGDTPYARDATYPPYAPVHLLIHLPFALLSPLAAGIAYYGFTILLTIALAYLALRLGGLRSGGPGVLALGGAILLSRPGHWTLLLGQVSILLTVATYLVFTADRGPPARSGAALALALLKVTYGLPLALLLWAWGRGRVAAWGLGLAAAVNLPLLVLLSVRQGGVSELLGAAGGGYRAWQTIPDVNPVTSSTRTDATSLLSRLTGEPLSDAGQVLLSGAILLISALVLRRLAPHPTRQARELAIAISCLAVSLVGFHRGYDLVLLTAPVVALLAPGSYVGESRGLRPALLLLFAVPALNWIATESVLAAWQPARPAWLLVTSANTVCLLGLLFAYLWLGIRYPRWEGRHLPGGPGVRKAGAPGDAGRAGRGPTARAT